jgi:hypothetical protein
MGRHRRCFQSRLIGKELPQPMDIKPLFGLCGVLIAAMTSELPSYIGRAERRPGCTRDQPRCWNLTRKPICVGRDHRHGDFALAVDDLHVKALHAFCDRVSAAQCASRRISCSCVNPSKAPHRSCHRWARPWQAPPAGRCTHDPAGSLINPRRIPRQVNRPHGHIEEDTRLPK